MFSSNTFVFGNVSGLINRLELYLVNIWWALCWIEAWPAVILKSEDCLPISGMFDTMLLKAAVFEAGSTAFDGVKMERADLLFLKNLKLLSFNSS